MELRYMVSRFINYVVNFKKFVICLLEIKYRILFYFFFFNKNFIIKWGVGEILCVYVIKVIDVKIYDFMIFIVFYGEKLKFMYICLLGY